MRITMLATLPPGGPDAVPKTSPPGFLQIGGTNALQIILAVSAGAVTGAPYFWDGANWVPLSGDAATGVVDDKADAATVAVAHQTYRRPKEPRFFAVLKTGGGTVSYCDVSEAVL